MFLKQVRQFIKFLNPADENDIIAHLRWRRWLFLNDRCWMVVKPFSPALGDVVDLTAPGTAADHVSHTNRDVLVVEQDVQRLIEA